MTKNEFKKKIDSVKEKTQNLTISTYYGCYNGPFTCNVMERVLYNTGFDGVLFIKKYKKFVNCKTGFDRKYETSHEDVLALRIFYLDMFEQEILSTHFNGE